MTASELPHLQGGSAGAESAVLILHGGREHGTMPTSLAQLSYLRMLDFYAALRWQSRSAAIYLLRYRVRGWNPGQVVPDAVLDARWALEQVTTRHPGVPIALLGHSMGGRAAFAVSDHPRVVGVCALAPWLPADEPLPRETSKASYVIAHGTSDRMTSAAQSLIYAGRLRAASRRVARFEFPGAKHAMLDQPGLWRRFAVGTSLGLVGDRPMPPTVVAALDGGPNRSSLSASLPDAILTRP